MTSALTRSTYVETF